MGLESFNPYVAAGTAVLGLGGSIFGQIQANKAMKKAEGFMQQRKNDLGSWFNENYYRPYLETEGARAGLSILDKNMREATKISQNQAAQGGATPEAVIAQQGEMQDKYQNAVNQLLAVGEEKKQNTENRYLGLKNAMDDQQQQLLFNKAANWQGFQNNLNSALGNVAGAWTTSKEG